jgi:hypothetical protein|tara:strand:+ start:6893 stop:7213 length:321 start_codon:yes stop_codon:yes gene_type:complete
MSICDVLIAVDNVNKDIVSEAIYEANYSVEVCEDQTFFLLSDIETDLSIDKSLMSIQGALDEIGEKNYSFVRANIVDNSMTITGNPRKFGVKAILKYGVPKSEELH